mgnify:CR=1 FL=1
MEPLQLVQHAPEVNTPLMILVKDLKTLCVFRASAAQPVNNVSPDAVLKTKLFVYLNLVTTRLVDSWSCITTDNGATSVRGG